MKLDTVTIRLILAIVEEGSISRAADRCNLAVAAASRRLSDLEGQLGARLFKRVPHGMRLTASGDALLQHIRQIDTLVGRLAGDAQALAEGHEGRLIIGAPKAVILQFLAADLAHLRQRHPGIALKVIEENSKIVQQLLRDKVIDIGIYEQTSGFLDLPRHPYRRDELVLVHHPDHFQLPPGPLGIEILLDLPIVSLGRGSAILSAVQRMYLNHGRHFRDDLIVSGFDTMLALVQHGMGVGLMPPQVLAGLRANDTLRATALAGDWHRRRYVLSSVDGHAQQQTLHGVVQALLAGRPAA